MPRLIRYVLAYGKAIQPHTAEALTIAEAVFDTRYNGAASAYAAGSIVRGQGT